MWIYIYIYICRFECHDKGGCGRSESRPTQQYTHRFTNKRGLKHGYCYFFRTVDDFVAVLWSAGVPEILVGFVVVRIIHNNFSQCANHK